MYSGSILLHLDRVMSTTTLSIAQRQSINISSAPILEVSGAANEVEVIDDDPCDERINYQEEIYPKRLYTHKVAKSKQARIRKLSCNVRKMKKLEDYLNSEKRKKLASIVQEKARAYKKKFDKAASICDADTSKPGVMVQVVDACNKLKNNESVSELMREAVEAAEYLMDMQAAMRELEADGDGVPVLCSLELSRQILDADVVGSEEIAVPEDG